MLIRPPEYINETEGYGAIKKKINIDYQSNQSIWQIFWTEATLDTRLEAGDTALMADLNQQLPNKDHGILIEFVLFVTWFLVISAKIANLLL